MAEQLYELTAGVFRLYHDVRISLVTKYPAVVSFLLEVISSASFRSVS